ncbi:LytTR family DNA-binding domain-containing protein [Emticicia sp. C21]|uniref:LytR/AlgR family response regulator transcription factor n=1 Tax=Emticicia sp. C21 TaxID=2302915 RepID=UPI000E344C91|nr:LytTR family DNA-binding domain-containing protein [Emticicia sp. C21]RFS17918.1 LytTR family transcriptional regulator [Emticicia sp. C21]
MTQLPTSSMVFFNKKTKVCINEILLLEGNINYTIVHLKEKSPLLIALTLKKVESLLKDHGFMRIHKSFLLNMSYADSSLLTNNQILSQKNIAIKISRRKRNELKERLSAA